MSTTIEYSGTDETTKLLDGTTPEASSSQEGGSEINYVVQQPQPGSAAIRIEQFEDAENETNSQEKISTETASRKFPSQVKLAHYEIQFNVAQPLG